MQTLQLIVPHFDVDAQSHRIAGGCGQAVLHPGEMQVSAAIKQNRSSLFKLTVLGLI